MRIVFITAALAVLSGPVLALDLKADLNAYRGRTMAEGAQGAQSSSGVLGGSIIHGSTGIVSRNDAGAVGNAKAINGLNQSSYVGNVKTFSQSNLNSSSNGLAGSIGGAGGDSQSLVDGIARQRSFGGSLRVKLH